MEDLTINNKVAGSPLITIDLEDYYPTEKRVFFDIKDLLYEGLVLKEKDFRDFLKNHSWQNYKDHWVAIGCSSDAIIPSWAFLLITTYLQPFAKKIVRGNLDLLEQYIYIDIINQLDLSKYQNQRVIIKGCSTHEIPENAYIYLIQKLQPLVYSIFYGEACSTVPLLKKNKL